MTKVQIDKLVADAVAAALAAAAGTSAPKPKAYEAGILKAGESCVVPKGHIALLVPECTSGKVTGKGKAYAMDTRGVALHKATGSGFKFQVWAIEE